MSWQRVCEEIEAQPKLSAEAEQALWQAHADGDARAKPKLIACTLRYALGIARRMAGGEHGKWEPGDLLGEAAKALSAAFDRWDGTGSFAAYTQPRLRGSMQDFLRRRANTMRGVADRGAMLSLDAPDEDGNDLHGSATTGEAVEDLDLDLTPQESRVLAATVLRFPPASPAQAAKALGLREATVARLLRSALRKSAATGAA